MSDLSFSAEAIARAQEATVGLVSEYLTKIIGNALLAHDADRLAREIIEQRVAKLTHEWIVDLGEDFTDMDGCFIGGTPEWRRELIRALTEQS